MNYENENNVPYNFKYSMMEICKNDNVIWKYLTNDET